MIKIFLSFRHGQPDETVADTLAKELRRAGIEVLRLKDDPPVAYDSTSAAINQKISNAVAIVTIWSDRARDSRYWVGHERNEAKKHGLRECMVRMPGTTHVPEGWPSIQGNVPDAFFLEANGILLRPVKKGATQSPPPNVILPHFRETVNAVVRFVKEQEKRRREQPPDTWRQG